MGEVIAFFCLIFLLWFAVMSVYHWFADADYPIRRFLQVLAGILGILFFVSIIGLLNRQFKPALIMMSISIVGLFLIYMRFKRIAKNIEEQIKQSQRKLEEQRIKLEEKRIKEHEEYEKRINTPEYKAEQTRKLDLELRPLKSIFRILFKLGYYRTQRSTEGLIVSHNNIARMINSECEIIKKITGVKLSTNEEILNFERYGLDEYLQKKGLKESKAGKLIDISKGWIDSNSANYSGIYIIVNNKTYDFYIGESQNMNFRRKTHLGDLLDNSHHSKLMQEHFNKYGKDVFDFFILESKRMENESVRKYAEELWIKNYQPTYN